MKKIMLIGLLCGFLANSVSAGTFPMFNDEVLEGVKTFDAALRIAVWMADDPFSDDSLPEQESFRTQANDAFVLGLRRDGVTVDETSLNTLYCDIHASLAAGYVTFTVTLDYWFWDTADDGVHKLLWEDRTVSGVGFNKFTPKSVAESCEDLFAQEWLKWNPK